MCHINKNGHSVSTAAAQFSSSGFRHDGIDDITSRHLMHAIDMDRQLLIQSYYLIHVDDLACRTQSRY